MFSRSCSSMTLAIMDSMAGIVPDKLHGLVHHQIFQPLFADSFLLACPSSFWPWHIYSSGGLLPSGLCRFRQTSAHRSNHSAAWLSAGNRPSAFPFSSGHGAFLFLESFPAHHRTDSSGTMGGIASGTTTSRNFSSPIITPVFEHVLHAVVSKFASDRVLDAVFIQTVPNLFHREAIPILRERFQHERGGKRVDVKFRSESSVYPNVPRPPLQRPFRCSLSVTDNLFGKVGRVSILHSPPEPIPNDTLWPLGDDLRRRHELDTVLFQLGFLYRALS